MLLSIVDFIGRFHPLLVHLPIGVLLLALLLQWLTRKEQYTISHPVMKLIWAIGILSALLSCITGYLLSLKGEYDDTAVALHMWMGIGVATVSLVIGAKVFSRQFDLVYKVSCAALLVLITATGHYGGSLTHGVDYLSSALLPEEETNNTEMMRPIANIQEANVYTDMVQPILQARCYSCHGKTKQKGKLRMDSPEAMMKGGKNGEIIVAGKGEESELIKRLLLPEDDDHHMPPKGKSQLSKKQISLLHWWIDQGAPFEKKIKEMKQEAEIKPVLASFQNGEQKRKSNDLIPEAEIKPADNAALSALKNKGIIVLPVAQNSHYLMASFITTADVSARDIQLLLPIKEQLIWLKLNHTSIQDDALAIIGQCTNLRVLQLSHTKITDKGLPALNSLSELRSLHLVGTAVSAKGFMQLSKLQKLQTAYLYGTNTSNQDWPALKRIFKNAVLDTGGYVVPTLATDTTEVKFVQNKKQ